MLYASPDELLTAERLASYKQLVLPDSYSLPEADLDAVMDWICRGGSAVAIGRVDPRLAEVVRQAPEAEEIVRSLRETERLLRVQNVDGLGVSLHRSAGGFALHLVNYGVNPESRCIQSIPSVRFELGWRPQRAEVHSFPASEARASLDGHALTAENLGLYTILDLR